MIDDTFYWQFLLWYFINMLIEFIAAAMQIPVSAVQSLLLTAVKLSEKF